ncbi:hypothetical protein MKJ04_03340 [Pontibacter sp. E15-1]|uniref:hypothetical protein n=1 Tax=Pontibacter sp. E15-1 TaxID=2919918 RepID=UPI001F4FFD70|nr:hypothetical protein [Pontibacter sp. E15-1]MCJ8163861.1 hypothetical protein [Pontibacter sp. E15-1]
MQTYFTNSFISIYYDQENHLGKAVWRGHLQGPELREAFLLCLEVIDRYNLTRWLADDRLMLSIAPADMEWSLEVHVPRMAGSSLLRMARLPSYSEENREAVDIMIDKGLHSDTKLAFRDFKDEKEAMAWLIQPL